MTVENLRVLEFFSGIGGLHYGLQLAQRLRKENNITENNFEYEVLASFDINDVANLCYEHNFHRKPLVTGIEHLPIEFLEKYDSNCWVLSPPCQPYTQGGKRLDHLDRRSSGLNHLTDYLSKLKNPPTFIFLENVPNFEQSQSRINLVSTLLSLGYDIKEFLVSPMQISIPNDRRRYYLTAKRVEKSSLMTCKTIEELDQKSYYHFGEPNLEQSKQQQVSLESYFEDFSGGDPMESYYVPDEYILKRYKFRFDIVSSTSTRSATFTKAYGSHHIKSSGSLIQTANFKEKMDFDDTPSILKFKPRFFTPKEIARLHDFPIEEDSNHFKYKLEFPSQLKRIQKYRLLGNSLNVRVVAHLMEKYLF